jgi:hypothetical protein
MHDMPADRHAKKGQTPHCAAHGSTFVDGRRALKKGVAAKIRELADTIRCACGRVCVNSDFRNLCAARDIGMERTLRCLEQDGGDCQYKMALSVGVFCQCPVRVQIAKHLPE